MPSVPLLTSIVEGSTSLLVPTESLRARNPRTYPVFFNPAARVNRDISVAVASVVDPRTYLDALAGVGSRGVRVANEGSSRTSVVMVDFNAASVEVSRMNVRANQAVGSRCTALHSEANVYLHSRFSRPEKFDYIDLDPFGTPAPYVQGALVAAADAAVVSLTATDTAVLCGAYPTAALRRYCVQLTRTEFMHEAALRVLAGFCVRIGAIHDIGVAPLAAHSTLHYLRLYIRVTRGPAAAARSLKSMGFVASCRTGCNENSVLESYSPTCPSCGERVRPIGPLWVGELIDEAGIVSPSLDFCLKKGWEDSAGVLGAVRGMNSFPPYGFSIENVASRERLSSVKLEGVLESLRARGFRAMRQPFSSGSAVKTDASYVEVLEAVRRYPRQTR